MDFDRHELHLVEALRTLRLLHYSYWIARRWDDPAFPAAFPWFGTQRYWQDRILELKEQIALMEDEPLEGWRMTLPLRVDYPDRLAGAGNPDGLPAIPLATAEGLLVALAGG